jgi:hypothetical protein
MSESTPRTRSKEKGGKSSRMASTSLLSCHASAALQQMNVVHMYYDGSYENGLYHGVGEFAEEDGSLYSGTWLLGLRQGQGTQANNRERHEYSGTFEADAYHGSGKCTWVNGSVYEGAWVRGVPNGVGM